MARKVKAQRKVTDVRNGAPVIDDEGFEVIGGDNSEMAVGEVVIGVYGGIVRYLEPLKKGGERLPVFQVGTRTLLGGTVLRNRIADGKVAEGDLLKITRLPDGKKKPGQNAPKLFAVAVKRAGGGKRRGRAS